MLTLERPIPHHVENPESNAKVVVPYEKVSFNLQRMTDMLDTDFVPIPKFDNTQDLINWIESGAK